MEVVIDIPGIKISKYEFEKNFYRFTESACNNNQSVTRDEKIEWIKNFTNRACFLADAYQKGYYKDNRVLDDVTRMGKHILTQPFGLYEETILPKDRKIPKLLTKKVNLHKENAVTGKKKNEIRNEYVSSILQNAELEINHDLLEKVFKRIQEDENYKQNNYEIDKSKFFDILEEFFFEYHSNKVKKKITLDDFIEFYNNVILRYPLQNKETIYSYIQDFLVTEANYKGAVDLGLNKDIKYLADKKNYTNDVVYYYYEQDEFFNKMEITDELLEATYNKNSDFFLVNEIKTSLFYFQTIEDANGATSALGELSEKNIPGIVNKLTNEFNLIDYKIGKLIYQENAKSLEDLRIAETLGTMIDNQLSDPVRIGNKFVLIKKHHYVDSRIRSYDEVKTEVREMVRSEKLQEMKEKRLKKIKQTFQLKDNIDYKKYLSDISCE